MIQYIQGDATYPRAPDGRGLTYSLIIAHVVNDVGGWGRGFVRALSARWSEPEAEYRAWQKQPGSKLGAIQLVSIPETPIFVANMMAQHGYSKPDYPAIRYDALEECLRKLHDVCLPMKAPSVHMPRIGCSLGGGRWSQVEPIIQRILGELDVYVYDPVGGVFNP